MKSRIYKSRMTKKWILRRGLGWHGFITWYEALAYLIKVEQGWPNRPEDILARPK